MRRLAMWLVAVALLVFAAGTTSATAAVFHAATKKTVFITGENVSAQVFTVKAGSVSCSTAAFAESEEYFVGHEPEAFPKIILVPNYSGCALSGLSSTVNVNKCGLTLSAETGQASFAGVAGSSCQKSGVVINTGTSCQWAFPNQVMGPIMFTNTKEGNVIASIGATAALTYSQSGPCGVGTFNNGSMSGQILLKGFVAGGEAVAIEVK